MNNQKSYKIVVRSKKMRNIRGASPAEVAKKVALKLLVKNIYSMYFSIIEIKTNKIIHYQSNKKELVRPYHKNGKLVKYRIVVKKMGKQVGGENPIYIYFPKDKYHISINNIKRNSKIIYIKDLSENNCLLLEFKKLEKPKYYIELLKLNRCQFQGSTNLKALINYANDLKTTTNLMYIFLIDDSYIPSINICLWLLFILATGESWYNKFGFRSEDHDSDIEHNSRIIEMNIEDFIKLIIRNINFFNQNNENNENINSILNNLNNENNLNNKNNEESIRNKITSFFEKYDKSKTVQEVFIQIKRQLLEEKISDEDINIIKKIFHIILSSRIISYNNNLKYTIP